MSTAQGYHDAAKGRVRESNALMPSSGPPHIRRASPKASCTGQLVRGPAGMRLVRPDPRGERRSGGRLIACLGAESQSSRGVFSQAPVSVAQVLFGYGDAQHLPGISDDPGGDRRTSGRVLRRPRVCQQSLQQAQLEIAHACCVAATRPTSTHRWNDSEHRPRRPPRTIRSMNWYFTERAWQDSPPRPAA
jgi:hypothetical protein